MKEPIKSSIGERVSYFAEVLPLSEKGWLRFVVVKKTLNPSRSNAPSFEIVSRHWTAGGAQRKAARLNGLRSAIDTFRGDR